jgi:DNA-binding GntR family transcriptional regulator
MSAVLSPPLAASSRLLRESIHDQLRADILSCKLAPGGDLREAELAERFNVSKSPVRDALMRLEREGLVITLPRQGYRVAPVSRADVEDMFHLRALLESACVERIVRRATDEQLQSLDAYRAYEAADWPGGFIEYNRSFHRRLAELAANGRMRDYLAELIDQMERVVLLSVNNVKQNKHQVLVNEHAAMVDALQSRNVKQAQKLAARHIDAAAKRVIAALERMAIAP